mmetsp:Transcript_34762/g.81505  ORF Transcript_34762/g.81505 Transcript_34762/m.81505 type:complete len:84 (+) Transcript_34762:375-626(+)
MFPVEGFLFSIHSLICFKVWAIKFSLDGRSLASASRDGTVVIFDVNCQSAGLSECRSWPQVLGVREWNSNGGLLMLWRGQEQE